MIKEGGQRRRKEGRKEGRKGRREERGKEGKVNYYFFI